MNIKILFGKNVRAFREAKGWSQDKLSDESGLHRTYISGIERGFRKPRHSHRERRAIFCCGRMKKKIIIFNL